MFRIFHILATAAGSLAAILWGVLRAEPLLAVPPPAIGPATYAAEPTTDGAQDHDLGPNAPELKTSSQVQLKLQTAQHHAGRGRYDLAAELWQDVLDGSSDVLTLRPGSRHGPADWPLVIFDSVARTVEERLASLPPAGLRVYRLTADPAALKLMSQPAGERRRAALAQVVARYYYSSHGDRAAYELGCLALDSHDFVQAAAAFNKLLAGHPDGVENRRAVELRLALALGRSGDVAAAHEILGRLARDADPAVSQLIAEIGQSFGKESVAGPSRLVSRDWTMEHGHPSRTGHQAALPADAWRGKPVALWSSRLVRQAAGSQAASTERTATSPADAAAATLAEWEALWESETATPGGPSPLPLVETWRKLEAAPAGKLLHHDGRLYVKSPRKLICLDAATGRLVWRSAWNNAYQAPPAMTPGFGGAPGGGFNAPGGAGAALTGEQYRLWRDRLRADMTIAAGAVFSLEGQRYADGAKPPAAGGAVRGHHYHGRRGVTIQRGRRNWLAAYDVRTGRALWRRSAEQTLAGRSAAAPRTASDATWSSYPPAASRAPLAPAPTVAPVSEPVPVAAAAAGGETAAADVGFAAAPTPHGDSLIVPVLDSGVLYVAALSASHGDTIWRTELSGDPPGAVNPSAKVGLAISGGDLYVATGAGAIYALDANTGVVQWVTVYPRSVGTNNQLRNRVGYAATNLNVVRGFQDDVVLVHGGSLVVMASDSDWTFALNRRTGRFQWRSPRAAPEQEPVDHCLGVVGNALFVAGPRVIRRIDLSRGGRPSGLLVWERKHRETSYGRAVVTAKALYVPEKDAIAVVDLATGKETRRLGAPRSPEPLVGNLASDGRRLYMLSPTRVVALAGSEYVLKQRAANSPGDHFVLARAAAVEQDWPRTAMHWRQAAAHLRAEQGAVATARQLLIELLETRVVERRPSLALELLLDRSPAAHESRHRAGAAPAEEHTQAMAAVLADKLVQRFVRSVLQRLSRRHDPGAVAALLMATPHLRDSERRRLATAALVNRAKAGDASRLAAAHEAADAATADLIQPALDKLLSRADAAQLAAWMNDGPAPLLRAAERELRRRKQP